MIKNPITAIINSNASVGFKWIAFGLLVLLLSAMPLMLYSVFASTGSGSMILTIIFAVGALIGHLGFLIGLLLLLRDVFLKRK